MVMKPTDTTTLALDLVAVVVVLRDGHYTNSYHPHPNLSNYKSVSIHERKV